MNHLLETASFTGGWRAGCHRDNISSVFGSCCLGMDRRELHGIGIQAATSSSSIQASSMKNQAPFSRTIQNQTMTDRGPGPISKSPRRPTTTALHTHTWLKRVKDRVVMRPSNSTANPWWLHVWLHARPSVGSATNSRASNYITPAELRPGKPGRP